MALEDADGKKLTEASSTIDADLGAPGLGEAGKATVTLAVPADAPADARLRITTDAKTNVFLPVKTTGAGSGQDTPGEGSSPAAKGVLGFFGALAAIAALIGGFFFNPHFAEEIQKQIKALLP